MPTNPIYRLDILAPRSGSVAETAAFLEALDSCYRHLHFFHSWADETIEHAREWRYQPFPGQPALWYSAQMLCSADPVAEPPLRIVAVQLQSPGFWAFLGALNPLETLRKYLVDRHERRKDHQWREELDAETKRLQLEELRIKVVKDKVDVLRNVGVPDSAIRKALFENVQKPLAALDIHQDSDLIGGPPSENTPSTPQSPWQAKQAPLHSLDTQQSGENKGFLENPPRRAIDLENE